MLQRETEREGERDLETEREGERERERERMAVPWYHNCQCSKLGLFDKFLLF